MSPLTMIPNDIPLTSLRIVPSTIPAPGQAAAPTNTHGDGSVQGPNSPPSATPVQGGNSNTPVISLPGNTSPSGHVQIRNFPPPTKEVDIVARDIRVTGSTMGEGAATASDNTMTNIPVIETTPAKNGEILPVTNALDIPKVQTQINVILSDIVMGNQVLLTKGPATWQATESETFQQFVHSPCVNSLDCNTNIVPIAASTATDLVFNTQTNGIAGQSVARSSTSINVIAKRADVTHQAEGSTSLVMVCMVDPTTRISGDSSAVKSTSTTKSTTKKTGTSSVKGLSSNVTVSSGTSISIDLAAITILLDWPTSSSSLRSAGCRTTPAVYILCIAATVATFLMCEM